MTIFGARNEVVNFNLILESPDQTTTGVSVEFNSLAGPNGATITTQEASGDGLLNWVGRNIELFYIRYLEIRGISAFIAEGYDERHYPEDFRRPYDEYGIGSGTWFDRPHHNAFYPEIAVPLELENNFSITAGENQSIWADIYIPKNIPSGLYQGLVDIKKDGETIRQLPVELTVRNFTLPDTPSAKTMLFLSCDDVNRRFFGEPWPIDSNIINAGTQILNKHFQMAHRHKISIIGANCGIGLGEYEDRPFDEWIPRFDGSLFTAAEGYDGPGVGVGNDIYSIGSYSSWYWKDEGEAGMHTHTNNWENWFQTNFPNVEHFLYLIDESNNFTQIEQWASWIESNPGIGGQLMSLVTTWVTNAFNEMPSVDIPASTGYLGDTIPVQTAVDYYLGRDDKRFYFYNGGRPGQGSFMTEDDGIALREVPWGQFKKHIDRWFYWQSTYYNNFQGGTGDTNLFQQAHTFGGCCSNSDVRGETGWNYCNGDGVLFYPGTDVVFPAESYGINGPIASLRLKHWRRGLQDVDYLTMAAQIDPVQVDQIVNNVIPKALWEYGVENPDDPTYVLTDISWSSDPDVWEEARAQLADIIEQ